MSEDREQQWMQRLARGDSAVIAELRDRYMPELLLFCKRMVYDEALAEDIVQEVMIKCLNPDAAPSGSLRGWLYRVARNRSIDALRRMKPELRLSAMQSSSRIWAAAVVPLDPTTTPAGKAMKADRARRVQEVVNAMDDGLREVVILYFFQGLSREEVAEAIGLTLSGTKARISRATCELRAKLRSLDDSSLE